jgi:hypothetical protein
MGYIIMNNALVALDIIPSDLYDKKNRLRVPCMQQSRKEPCTDQQNIPAV